MTNFDVTSRTSADLVAESLAYKLGFTSPKRHVSITIRFKPGASHTSWTSKKSSIRDCAELAAKLVQGYRTKSYKGPRTSRHRDIVYSTIPARPIFDAYMDLYEEEAIELCVRAFKTYSHWSVKQRAEQAGKAIIRDMCNRTREGALGLYPNQGKYAAKKMRYGYGNAPFIATGELLRNLEVVVR